MCWPFVVGDRASPEHRVGAVPVEGLVPYEGGIRGELGGEIVAPPNLGGSAEPSPSTQPFLPCALRLVANEIREIVPMRSPAFM